MKHQASQRARQQVVYCPWLRTKVGTSFGTGGSKGGSLHLPSLYLPGPFVRSTGCCKYVVRGWHLCWRADPASAMLAMRLLPACRAAASSFGGVRDVYGPAVALVAAAPATAHGSGPPSSPLCVCFPCPSHAEVCACVCVLAPPLSTFQCRRREEMAGARVSMAVATPAW